LSFEDILERKETDLVLDQILENAVRYTSSDGGSIYFIERANRKGETGDRVLKFHNSLNKTKLKKNAFKSDVVNIDDKSFAGYVALTGKCIRIDNCYNRTDKLPCVFNKSFDEKTGYKTVSIMATPIVSEKDGLIGVVQLINKTKSINGVTETIVFTDHDELLVEAVAAQAAVALEKAELSEEIENLFESFVQASVSAIESRDPTTSGHSERVATMTTELAKSVDTLKVGPLKDIIFSKQQILEIRYASLLHDFGKIGVSERVLLKANKLYPHELESIMLRMDLLKKSKESEVWKRLHFDETIKISQEEAQKTVKEFSERVEALKEAVVRADRAQIKANDLDINSLLCEIREISKSIDQVLVTEEEILRLSIPRGSLTEGERQEIESHVTLTYNFLKRIAWSEGFANVPSIAFAHHEKLDGSGYPRKLNASHIPIQAKIMTVCDIYDALTALDRPYKKALSAERAIEILHYEVKDGKLDPELLKIFVEAKVFNFGTNKKEDLKKAVG